MSIFQIRLTILVSFLILSINIFSQEITLTKLYADSVKRYNWERGYELQAIVAYNKAVKAVGYVDTISLMRDVGLYQYWFHGVPMETFGVGRSNSVYPVSIHFGGVVMAEVRRTEEDSFEIFMHEEKPNEDPKIGLKNYKSGILYGRQWDQTLSGKILFTGGYAAIDSIYNDTLLVLDPDTYEDVKQIIPRTKFPVKCGSWKYYELNGNLLQEEKYVPCHDD